MYNIPIFKLDFDDKFIKDFQKGSEDIFKSKSLTEYLHVQKFENDFSNLIYAKYCSAVTNGTAALEVALRCFDVRGKNVICPSNTYFATPIAITNAGGNIELIDIENESLSICPSELKKKINKNTGAVILVHIGGIISKFYKEIKNICEENNVPLIEDAAHAHLSHRGQSFAGSIGDIGCFSFFPTKVMTTGQGGMITTNSEELINKIKSLKNFGRDNPASVRNTEAFCTLEQGSNYRISEFTGLLGHLECARVKKRIEKRNKLIGFYQKYLNVSDYKIITQDSGYCSYYKCIIETHFDRDKLYEHCYKNGISLTGEVYRTPVHLQPLYKPKFGHLKLPNTEKFCENHICPPLYPELSEQEIEYICKILTDFEN